MDLRVAGFDWDQGDRDKCCKQSVAIADIEAAFLKPITVFSDLRHSQAEERFKAIGTSGEGRYIFFAFTPRKLGNEIFVRPISARYMHKKEVAHDEEEICKAAE